MDDIQCQDLRCLLMYPCSSLCLGPSTTCHHCCPHHHCSVSAPWLWPSLCRHLDLMPTPCAFPLSLQDTPFATAAWDMGGICLASFHAHTGSRDDVLGGKTVISVSQEPADTLFSLLPQSGLPLVHTDSQNMAQCNPSINYIW